MKTPAIKKGGKYKNLHWLQPHTEIECTCYGYFQCLQSPTKKKDGNMNRRVCKYRMKVIKMFRAQIKN